MPSIKGRPPASTVHPLKDKEWWDKITAPILKFLEEWRTWEDLNLWRKSKTKLKENELVNGLAYLHVNRKARYHVSSRKWGPLYGALPSNATNTNSSVARVPIAQNAETHQKRSRTRRPPTSPD